MKLYVWCFFLVFCLTAFLLSSFPTHLLHPHHPHHPRHRRDPRLQYASSIMRLAAKARSVVRDLDPQNDLTFLRIRSKKHEIMVAPDNEFLLIVIQDPTASNKK